MTNKIQAARQPGFGFDRNSPLGRFWLWWSGELIALAPLWLRQSSASVGYALMIEVTPQAIVLRRWLQGTLTEQGRLDLQSGDNATYSIAFQALFNKLHKRGERVALWLADAQCLTKQVELPLAAAENLRQVLSFEMDRYTPFKADQVYFDFRVLRRDNQISRITVKLVAVPRLAVDGSLELLRRWGAPAHAVYVADTAAPNGDAVNLMPTEQRTPEPSRLRGVNLGLLLLTLMLAMAAIAIHVWQKREAVITLMPMVDRAKLQAVATDALRREQEKLTAEYNFMLDKKHAAPPLVVVLEELSRLLPDDTWVQQFNFKGKELQIQGETASSSKLIALIESSSMLHDANFRSPLTKGYTPNSERYHLAAEVKALSTATLATSVSAPPVIQPAPQPVASGSDKPAQGIQQTSQSGKLDEIRQNPQLPPPAATKLPVPNEQDKSAVKVPQHPEVKH